MTAPIIPSDSFDVYKDAGNAIGLSILQERDLQDYLSTFTGDIGDKFGDLISWITDGIATVITDVQEFIVSGDTSNFLDIADYIQNKLLEIPREVISIFATIVNAFLGDYTGDDEALTIIQALFAPIRALLQLVTGVTGIPSEGQVTGGPLADAITAVSNLIQWLQDLIDAICSAFRRVPVAGGSIANAFEDMANTQELVDGTRAGIVEGWNAGSTSGADLGVYAVFMDIQTAIAAGYTVQTITSSQTWAKPASATHEIVVIAIGSGQTGPNGTAGYRSTAAQGGLGGGYLAQTFKPDTVPATVAITIGAGGAQTSFGSLLTTTAGSGGIATPFGYSDTTSLPGRGGNGGHQIGGDPVTNIPATNGQSTPLAAGGLASAIAGEASSDGRHGAAGGNVDTTTTTRCGGAGGGGGDYGRQFLGAAYAGGNGGAGGYPGGGGGAGGQKAPGIGTGNPGNGGAGGQGVMFVFSK